MAEKFAPRHTDQFEDPKRLVELPSANLMELLRLSPTQVRALLTGAGLRELAACEPDAAGPYHHVIVTEKPAS